MIAKHMINNFFFFFFFWVTSLQILVYIKLNGAGYMLLVFTWMSHTTAIGEKAATLLSLLFNRVTENENRNLGRYS